MKKIICILASLLLTASLASCGENQEIELETDEHGHVISDGHTHAGEVQTDEHGHDISDGHTHAAIEIPDTINPDLKETFSEEEDAAYHDLFYNENTSAYENKSFTKYGTFAKIYDAYNLCTRYYVWGYGDTSKSCCYQWEFVMPDSADIPSDGSYVKVTGTMTASEDALDGYWLTNVTLSVEEAFAETDYDYDFVTLSPTLTRVQVINMLNKNDSFKNVSVRLPAYIQTESTLCSVFNDSSWSMHYTDSTSSVKASDYTVIDGIFNASGTDTLLEIVSAQPIE